MSTKVAVIYEDHTNDRYIIDPVISAALKHLGCSNPRVSAVTNPRMTGFDSLIEQLCDVVGRYHKAVQIVVIAFDLDGEDGKDGRADKRLRVENALARCELGASNVVLLGSVMEAEVYALWGSRSSIEDSWTEVRSERDPKEFYFDALIADSDRLAADGGRSRLMTKSLSAGWPSLRGGCPELQTFETDLAAVIAGT